MPRTRRFPGLWALSCILLLVGCGGSGTPETPTKAWTLMMYLDGDEVSMQQDFMKAFAEMVALQVGSTDQVDVVIQFDRLPSPDYPGDWTIAHRFHQTPGMEPTEANAIPDWGDGQGGREVDTSDPDTLSSFVTWATTHYPADRYALLVGDHGYGWQGLMIDETSHGDYMTLKGFRRALEDAGVRIDVLAFDACVMQMAEVQYELGDLPLEIVVGSENLGTTWPLAGIVQSLTANPTTSAEGLGRAVVDLYATEHATEPTITLSAVRLHHAGAVTLAVRDLADAFLADEDLAVFKAKAQAVVDVLDEAIVYARNGANWPTAYGVSVYFPETDAGYMPMSFFYEYVEQTAAFAADARWRELLYVYLNALSYETTLNDVLHQVRGPMDAFDGVDVDLKDLCKRIVGYTP